MSTPPLPHLAIDAQGLTRTFGAVTAVDGISLQIQPGELVAFLGPNGAGKTTTLRMLTTLLAPTAGSARVAGYDVATQPHMVRRHIGYVGQRHGSGQWHHGRDELVYTARSYGMSPLLARQRVDELTRVLQLDGILDRKSMTLSGGQRRRLDIAMGVVHRPGLVFLDEPSAGLDPQNRAGLHDHIREMHTRDLTTLVLTTHYLEEADALASRVVVVDHGRVIADDTPAALKAGLGDALTLTFADDATARRAAGTMPAHVNASVEGAVVTGRAPHADRLVAELLPRLATDGTPATAVAVTPSTLDDVFLHLTGRSLRDAAVPTDTAAPQEVAA